MPNKKAITGIAIAGGLFATLYFATRAKAIPPPVTGFPCPYCPSRFDTYEELVAHVQTVHPGQRIPLPIEWE